MYDKVWKNGAKGDLGRFLGVSTPTEAASLSTNVPAKDATVPAKATEPSTVIRH